MRGRGPQPRWGRSLRGLIALSLMLAPLPALAQEIDPYTPESFEGRKHVEWSRDAVIYQLNTRQFSKEGTLKAAEAQLPRLHELGVDIIWLMPIHPIGEQNRKGMLGSPYSITDYKAVRAELGTMEDLKSFVETAHGLGMKVILDWVANHTAWDHPWRTEHPDWYEHDWQGNNVSTPFWHWSDIVDLNYDSVELRHAMSDALQFWVREADIDGYRADVAGYIPPDFWADVRRDLEAIKPVWMLGEFGQRDLHMESFDASYAWDWEKALRRIAAGEGDATSLYGFYSEHASLWPTGAQRMIFTTNHDENAWSGTTDELLGKAFNNAVVLMFTSEGIPLIYSGQEAGLDKRLEFFERDPIVWRDHPNAALFKKWISFRDRNPALQNAPWGGSMVHVKNSDEAKIFSFVRRAGNNAVFVLQNYSDQRTTVTLGDMPYAGTWLRQPMEEGSNAILGRGYTSSPWTLDKGSEIEIAPWSSVVFYRGFQP